MPDPIELRIEKLVYGGDGLGHHDGHTVFVPFVLPEETRLRSHPPEQRKKFIRGRVEQITAAVRRSHRRALPALRRLRRLQLPAHSVRARSLTL